MRRIVWNVLLGLLVVSVPGAAHGRPVPPPDATTGRQLLRSCGTAGYGSDFWFCQGYLAGFHQTIVALVSLGAMKPPYCPPARFTNRLLRNVVVAYLEAYPDQLDGSAEMMTLAALSTAYPCRAQ
jgi:hypothetical protein